VTGIEKNCYKDMIKNIADFNFFYLAPRKNFGCHGHGTEGVGHELHFLIVKSPVIYAPAVTTTYYVYGGDTF